MMQYLTLEEHGSINGIKTLQLKPDPAGRSGLPSDPGFLILFPWLPAPIIVKQPIPEIVRTPGIKDSNTLSLGSRMCITKCIGEISYSYV